MINYSLIAPPPTIQASSFACSEVSDTQLVLSWTRGNGVAVMVTARLTTTAVATPPDGVTYSANTIFGSGDQVGTGVYVIYKGTSSSITVTGLIASTAYTFGIYEMNQKANGTEKYNISSVTTAQTTLPPQVAPTTQATSLVFTGDRKLSFTRGDGARILIVAKSGGAVDSDPVDNTVYTAAVFGSGTQIGTGNYVVYDGTASAYADLLGFSQGGTYGVRVYEYNLASGNPKYNTNTATGNPITASMPSVQTWYQYKDTAFLTRRDVNTPGILVSREFSQLYPIGSYLGSTYEFVWFVSEGDGTNQNGIDRTIRFRRAIADDPRLAASWVRDSPVNGDGDTPAFVDSGSETWNSKQDWGPMGVLDAGGGTLYGYYPANGPIVSSRYSVGLMTSTDEFETYTRYGTTAVIPDNSSLSSFYAHPFKDGSDWWMFIQNYTPALLVEGHLFCLQIWHSNDGISWTKQTTVDQMSGRNLYGAIDISQPWKEGSVYYAFISHNSNQITGGYNAKAEGQTQYLSTNPVGNQILLISWTDWSTFNTSFIIERIIFTSTQNTEIDVRTWTPKRTWGGFDYFISMSFLWKGQTALNGNHTMEPMNDGKIIATGLISSGNTVIGAEVYPGWLYALGKPHQSHLDDTLGGTPLPYNILTSTNGTVVGSPRISFFNHIQPVDNGFVTDPNFTYDCNYFAFKISVGRNALTTIYGLCGMDTDVGGGQHGWHIRKQGQYTYEVWIYSSDNSHYKRYRATSTANGTSGSDATQLITIGFIWMNGTLQLCIDNNLNCTVTKVVDDVFTTMNQTNEVLRIGAIYPITNDEMYSQDVVGPWMALSGVSNVTESNYKNNNFLGY